MSADQDISQLLGLARDRTAYQNPLFQALSQQAFQGLPAYARQGTQLSGTLSNQAPPPSQSGGGIGLGGALASGGLGALLGSALSGGGGPLGALLQGLKKLFGAGGGQNSVQGDSPFGGGALTGPNTLFSGYEQDPQASWNSGLPWEQPNLPSDPGFYTGMGFPNDPSNGSGVGPGMAQYYGGASGDSGPDDNWWHP